MRYYVRMDKLKEAGENLSKYANDTVKGKINELQTIINKVQWEGPAHELYLEVYKKKIKELLKIGDLIEVYGKFMVFASENYTKTNKDLIKSWQQFLEEQKQKEMEEQANEIATQST